MQYHSQDHCQSCVSFGKGESSQIRNNNTTGFVFFWQSCCPYTLVISLKVRDNIWNRNLVRKQLQEFVYRTRRGKRLHMGLQYYEEHAIEFFLNLELFYLILDNYKCQLFPFQCKKQCYELVVFLIELHFSETNNVTVRAWGRRHYTSSSSSQVFILLLQKYGKSWLVNSAEMQSSIYCCFGLRVKND